ncbi:lipase [Oscillatoria sp. CS-180]|uniref:esterase/lipase family protein n=1 Tax=Oscillatoria sp. CS-180 TaxID=3021720 RepID=UPI00232F11EA|nr:lipase [Oscillatoria sp. CS-180]MDB9526193.1 lipase [Oscillatoria sp. CS-180]
MPLPTVIIPGYLAGAAPYRSLAADLNQRGIWTKTVPLTQASWLPTIGGRSVQPILAAIAQTVNEATSTTGCDRVNLVGHSAGGWIARIYLGDVPYAVHKADQTRQNTWSGYKQVETLLTLGTPHVSQERWTRRNLDFVNQTYPGVHHDTVNYICIAGKAVFGRRWRTWFTYNSYKLTVGEGACWGDGITPITAAHLPDAKNITLEGVYHSPKPGIAWYGSPQVVDQWVLYLRNE